MPANNAAMLRFAHALGFAIEPLADDLRTVRITLKLRPPISPGGLPATVEHPTTR